MTERHLRKAFFDLVSGRGSPHSAEVDCRQCREAAEFRTQFEHEFDGVMRAMAPEPMPRATVPAAPTARVAVGSWAGAFGALLLVAGVAMGMSGGLLIGDAGRSSPPRGSATITAPAETELDRWLRDLPLVLGRTSSFQAAIIRDGIVTDEEHERAADAYLSCLRDAGIVAGASRDEHGIIDGLTLRANDPNDDVDEVNNQCEREFYADVRPGRYAVVKGGDTQEAPLRRLIECLIGLGYDVRRDARDFVEVRDAIGEDQAGIRDFGRCVDETQYP